MLKDVFTFSRPISSLTHLGIWSMDGGYLEVTAELTKLFPKKLFKGTPYLIVSFEIRMSNFTGYYN